eukprot:gene7102-7854_t
MALIGVEKLFFIAGENLLWPHVLPMYKASSLQGKAYRKSGSPFCVQVLMVVLTAFLVFLLAMALYMGSLFLQSSLSDFSDTLPGTRNVLQKWSGLDLTALGRPPLTNASSEVVERLQRWDNATRSFATNYLRVHPLSPPAAKASVASQ